MRKKVETKGGGLKGTFLTHRERGGKGTQAEAEVTIRVPKGKGTG